MLVQVTTWEGPGMRVHLQKLMPHKLRTTAIKLGSPIS